AVPGLFLIGIACTTLAIGPYAVGLLVWPGFSDLHVATIAMFALAGELARVVNAELGLRRLLQSVLAGTRFTPIVAPLLAAALQGPLFMRSGRSFEGELAREASEMLHVMESQGVDRGAAWGALAAGGACALLLAPSFLSIIVSTAFNQSIYYFWLGVFTPAAVLLTAMIAIAIVVSRMSKIAPAPN